MSEKIKAVRGNSQRCEDVVTWLEDHGAKDAKHQVEGSRDYKMYFVDPNGDAQCIDENYECLFDVEELPRWRAKENDPFYCIDGTFNIAYVADCRSDTDNLLYEIGNYFQTEAEAVYYCDKFKEMLKERK